MAFVAGDFQAGSAYTSGTQTWSVAMPASVQAGDWLYLCICTNSDHTVTTINGSSASGTTEGSTADGWTLMVRNTSAADGFAIWEKKHDGSEADPCVVVYDAIEVGVGAIFRVRNAASTTPRGGLNSATSSTTTSSVTPPADNHAIIAVLHIDPAAETTYTWADATEIFDYPEGANASIAAAYIIQTTATGQAIAYTPSPGATVGYSVWEMEPGSDTPITDATEKLRIVSSNLRFA